MRYAHGRSPAHEDFDSQSTVCGCRVAAWRTVGARDMNEEKATQGGTGAEPQPKPETRPTEANASMPSQDVGWARASTSQVVRTVAIALLTTAVVLGALFLLWQIRTFIGWFVISLFLAGAQPCGQLAPAPTQAHEAPPRHRAHLPGAGGSADLCGGDLLARAGRPDKWVDQIRCHRG